MIALVLSRITSFLLPVILFVLVAFDVPSHAFKFFYLCTFLFVAHWLNLIGLFFVSTYKHPIDKFTLFATLVSVTVVYAGCYFALNNLDRSHFPQIKQEESVIHEFHRYIYFAATTTSTVGYGDIFPSTVTAQYFVVSQMTFNILLLVILN